ncbi:MAG: trypsin-like serine peptidase [Geminicoccaceae bacterium]
MIRARHWNSRYLPFVSAFLLGVSTSTISAQEVVSSAAKSDPDYWTAERVLNAQPIDERDPLVSLSELVAAADDISASLDSNSVTEDGAAPSLSLTAADYGEAIYSPDEAAQSNGAAVDDVEPNDAGTSNAYFSSSRLIPTDARRTYPYRAVGKLFFTQPGQGNFVCSAAVLRPRIILTAGHCVHSGTNGPNGFYRNFQFVPAFHQGRADFFRWNAVWLVTTGSWASGGGNVPNRADFAIIELRDRVFQGAPRRVGAFTGFFGFQTNALVPNHAKLLGYPVNFDSGQIMHQVDAGAAATAPAETVLYGSDMQGGSSGGPWVENFGQPAAGQTGGQAFRPNRIVGVTSYAFTDVAVMLQGSSILNNEFLAIYNRACGRRAGNC